MNQSDIDDPGGFLAAIVQSSYDAIVGKSLQGIVRSWNAGAERLFGYAPEEIIGRSITTLIPPDRLGEEDRILSSVTRGEVVPMFETIRLRKDGSEIPVAVTVSPVRDAQGQIVAASKIARDMTEMREMKSLLSDTQTRFDLVANNISQLAWMADATGAISWYNQRWYDYTGTTFEEMQGWGWSRVHHPDRLADVTERWRAHLASGETWEDTFPLRGADGSYRWFLSRATPSRDSEGRIVSWFGTNTDITDMRDAEQRIQLLLMEVNHRSKNMLTIIQALARRSLREGGDAVAEFEERVRAMATNQDLLVASSWSSVPVREVIEAQLGFLFESQQAQIAIEGPSLSLAPAAAEAIGMAVHELATNAMKYGSLSVAEGLVSVTWGTKGEAADQRFWIDWRESGGPPVVKPERSGFGSRIIADVPRSKMSADVDLTYAAEGFRWLLECPAQMALGKET